MRALASLLLVTLAAFAPLFDIQDLNTSTATIIASRKSSPFSSSEQDFFLGLYNDKGRRIGPLSSHCPSQFAPEDTAGLSLLDAEMLVKYAKLPGAVVVAMGHEGGGDERAFYRDNEKVWGAWASAGSGTRSPLKGVARLVHGSDMDRLARAARHPNDTPGDCPSARQTPTEVRDRLLSRPAVGRGDTDACVSFLITCLTVVLWSYFL